ncbi:MAG: citrate transporter, partial [Thermoplasmata archaeon]|nr:citrate transporter [Thermoplasmata archaeon]
MHTCSNTGDFCETHKKEVGKTNAPQIIAIIIFAASYVLIFSGKVERSVAALLGLFMMVSAGYAIGFMNFEDALSHVDWSVILLLFGMMTYVGLMAKTGFFKYLGVKAIKMAKGKPWLIFLYLSLITTFVSMVIDNVTTILLVVPLTVEIAEMLEINPVPVMLGEAVLSNVGGVATMIGDPPNIMIAFASKFNFNDFLINLFPPVATSLLVSILLGRLVYRKWVKNEAKNVEKLMEIDERMYIRNRKKMNYYLYILFVMLLFFATETYTGISPAFVALSGGVITLIISSETPKEAFRAVEWPTLVFFIALFSLVGGLEQTGVLEML